MKWLLLLFLLPLQALAINYPYLLRSPRGLLMGDAFTAVNDDDYTLLYNPASLGRHKHDLTLYPLNGHIHVTNVLADMDRFEDFPDEPVGVADVMMDYPVHAQAGLAPGFKMFNVGVTFISNDSYDILLRNRTHPMMDVDIRKDRGVIVGMGIPISGGFDKKSKSGSRTSLGLAAKFIDRTGLQDTLALTGPTVLDSMGQDDAQELVKTLGEVKGKAFGFDAGFEHTMRSGPTQFTVGLAALDITGTEFKYVAEDNPDDLKVADIDDQINLGVAWGQDWKFFDYTFSADIRALNENIETGKRLRLGAEVGLPGLRFMAGVNSGYYSYGATLDLLFLKLTGGFYDVEIGSKYKQIQSKRLVIYLSLFDFSFDA